MSKDNNSYSSQAPTSSRRASCPSQAPRSPRKAACAFQGTQKPQPPTSPQFLQPPAGSFPAAFRESRSATIDHKLNAREKITGSHLVAASKCVLSRSHSCFMALDAAPSPTSFPAFSLCDSVFGARELSAPGSRKSSQTDGGFLLGRWAFSVIAVARVESGAPAEY